MHLFSVIMTLAIFLCEASANANSTDKTLTLGYLVPWSHDWAVGPSMGAAIILGIEEIKVRGLLGGYEISWTWRDTWCKPLQAMKMTVEIWSTELDLDAIIGDGCSVGCSPAGLLSAGWGIPCVSWACNSMGLSDKHTYPTFSRVSHTNAALAPIMTGMLQVFNWTTVGVLSSPDEVSKLTADIVMYEMINKDIHVERRIIHQTMRGEEIDQEAYMAMEDSIREIKDKVRIIFLFVYASDFRNILIAAYDMGLLNGEYVFVSTDLAYLLTAKFSYRPELGPDLYQGVLLGSIAVPSGPRWEKFVKRVVRAFDHPAFADVPHVTQADAIDTYAGAEVQEREAGGQALLPLLKLKLKLLSPSFDPPLPWMKVFSDAQGGAVVNEICLLPGET